MWLASLAFVLGGQAVAPAAPLSRQPITVTNTTPRPLADPIGSCEANGKSYNLHRLMLLENKSVEMDGPRGAIRVSIVEEYVQIHMAAASPSRAVFSTNIGDTAEPNRDLDVELKLGYFEGKLVLFWKETFRHRIYRQGLYLIAGDRVTPLCSGYGGVTVRD